ncbi:uncharacterized protein LOC131254797 [Magnolia sinica]|uniref:uncharacterized protein LOC131254797 n=1 Tax=Magnolia sinica TaxID=86752 RepID=UPI00265A26E1|nr:uncharacterized protein LOC131254797 [Magnolia sinica]XP_058111497.1 uncharacterized protein LOC131254797 [Magnolia sinica]XP_058111498.1 uncharacterized protein LOC131254797 [Magnolia sinica]
MDTLRNLSTPDGTQRSEPEILSEVLDTCSGYVRGLGHGAKLMAPARAASTRSIVVGESATRRADIAEKKVQQLQVVVYDIREQLEKKSEQLDRQMEEQERRMEDLTRQREEQERRMEDLTRQREEQERRRMEEQAREREE